MRRRLQAFVRHRDPPKVTAAAPIWYPLIAAALTVCLLESLDLDRALAHALFFRDATGSWVGDGPGAWWARDLIHEGGRMLVRLVAATALAVWGLSFAIPRLSPCRREALFVFLGILLVTGVVGTLKVLTNVDCPWDIAGFGGSRPYIALLGDRPDYLARARCFPGAHSSSGFALLSIHFALGNRGGRLARRTQATAWLVGVVFAFGQEARGAHFLSHDLVSAALAWCLLSHLRLRMLARRAAPALAGAASGSGLWRRFLPGRLLAAEIPDDGADHDHRDANAVADTYSPVVDPAEQPELHVHEMQHERAGTEQYQKSTDSLHDSPLEDCCCSGNARTLRRAPS
jgi:membrane-associated PAP2 superfamily phosphatase